MRKDLEERLVKEFPNLYRDYGGDPRTTCMTWGFAHGDGWFDIIYDLSKKLTKLEPHIVADQVKEKFGGLRFYYHGEECDCKEPSGSVMDAVDEAEKTSYKTCEFCGKSGKPREDLGWIRTLCDKCYSGKMKEITARREATFATYRARKKSK